MRIAIFDIESTGFNADFSLLLCCSIKEYGKRKVTTIRADEFSKWKKSRIDNNKAVVEATLAELEDYDMLIAHNGEFFDKRFLHTQALRYNLGAPLRFKKLIDPVLVARRHMKMGRNSLAALIDYFKISEKKTPLDLEQWMRAGYDADNVALQKVVTHCIQDVKSLEMVYDKLRPLIDKIDSRGSSF